MVKASESRSTARRAILRKCAAVMPFLSQPTPQDSMPEAFPRLGNGRPVTDYDFHAYSAARGDTTGMSPRDRLEGLALDLTDDANNSLWRDVVLSTNPISGVPYNLLKARGNYLRAGDAAATGDLSRATDRHLESVGDAAMAGLSIVPGTSLVRFGPKAVAAARTALTGKRLLQGAGVGSGVTFANDYHAHVSNGRNPGVAAARALTSSLPGWRSYAQHPTAAHPYEFTLGPAGVPAGGTAVGQYAPAAAERQ